MDTTPDTEGRARLKAAIRDLLVREPVLFYSVLREVRSEMKEAPVTDHPKKERSLESFLEEEAFMLSEVFKGFA
ncbi:hypothetical protein [Lewinella sp. IMCC34183]|uniref:hypothetical protein n=1 Tax=Lewinella sp. IMCC34183 TaxID=2248762 RepID=UPI000E21C59A|nr:hypothetical protein [Lewinella sp. IMCC34183]